MGERADGQARARALSPIPRVCTDERNREARARAKREVMIDGTGERERDSPLRQCVRHALSLARSPEDTIGNPVESKDRTERTRGGRGTRSALLLPRCRGVADERADCVARRVSLSGRKINVSACGNRFPTRPFVASSVSAGI